MSNEFKSFKKQEVQPNSLQKEQKSGLNFEQFKSCVNHKKLRLQAMTSLKGLEKINASQQRNQPEDRNHSSR
jgi:hypothetical protein